MPSPFPGKDPYLEQEVLWHDFHEKVIPAAAYLAAQVLPRYIVLTDENVYLHELDIERESFLEVRDRQNRELVGRDDVGAFEDGVGPGEEPRSEFGAVMTGSPGRC